MIASNMRELNGYCELDMEIAMSSQNIDIYEVLRIR